MPIPQLWMAICGTCAYVIKKRRDKQRPRPPQPPVSTPQPPPGSFTTPEPPDSSLPPGAVPQVPGIVGTPQWTPGTFTTPSGPRSNRRRGRRRGRALRN